ncbi:mitochondrial carrier [Rhizopus microsporus]|uniref:Mitochondrial carrier n=1 Tax=Rhizopus microsporus TaxID=58291 RepID=A0A1X0RKM3_RHIZD|nr:mitochondrial carrier [Rhizopus microsporus]
MPSHVTSSKLNANEIALCGGIAGVATRYYKHTCVYIYIYCPYGLTLEYRFAISPLDVIKIRLQIQSSPARSPMIQHNAKYSGILSTFKTIIKEEGIRGLFKGNVAAEYLYLAYGISQFYAYYHMDAFMEKLTPSLKPFVSGMVAGSFATATTYPFDLLRTRFAVQGTNKASVYNSILHAISDIYGKEGIKGFYRGLGSSITQIMPYMGLMFFSYEGLCSLTQTLKEKGVISDKHNKTNDMICGSLAGIISKTGVFPLDVVRKRLQVQGPHISKYVIASIPIYSQQISAFSCMRTIIQTEGYRALYKGLTPGLLKAGPSGAVYFLVFELSKDFIIKMKENGYQILPETTFPYQVA